MWLDDVRPAPAGWVHVKTVNEAKALLQTGQVEHASLDHDLSDFDSHGGTGYMPSSSREQTGYDLVKWMAETNTWPTQSCVVHSANPVGVMAMQRTIERYGPYNKESK
jgi:hypothetical protein